MSSIQGLNTLLTALRANQQALYVTSHNVANANTEGYSRQVVNLEALTAPGGMQISEQIGQGVQMAQINRVRNAFFDQQFRAEDQALGYYTTRHDALDQLQTIIGEPSDKGLRNTLQRFWGAWGDLANQPDSQADRAAVREAANALADSIRHQATQLTDLKHSLDQTVATKAQEINSLADQLATVNKEVVAAAATGSTPNDLMDKRDLLLDKLSSLERIQVQAQSNGGVSVVAAGGLLVDGATAHHMLPTSGPNGTTALTWDYDGSAVTPAGGELLGLTTARDTLIPNYQNQLSTLTSALVQAVNTQHAGGVGLNGATGNPFFDPASTPSSIRISTPVAADLKNIAAAMTAAPGDGTNAQAIAALQRAPTVNGGTLDDYYSGAVSGIGVATQVAQRGESTEQVLTQQINNLRQSAGGVSLDEEMTAMIKYQKSYEAAARMVTAMDSLLDTVVNRMGIR